MKLEKMRLGFPSRDQKREKRRRAFIFFSSLELNNMYFIEGSISPLNVHKQEGTPSQPEGYSASFFFFISKKELHCFVPSGMTIIGDEQQKRNSTKCPRVKIN